VWRHAGGAATAPLTEPLRLDFSRDWEGTVQLGHCTIAVQLSRGELTAFFPRRTCKGPFVLTLSPGGLAHVRWDKVPYHGT
jgi:hypothetical protein